MALMAERYSIGPSFPAEDATGDEPADDGDPGQHGERQQLRRRSQPRVLEALHARRREVADP